MIHLDDEALERIYSSAENSDELLHGFPLEAIRGDDSLLLAIHGAKPYESDSEAVLKEARIKYPFLNERNEEALQKIVENTAGPALYYDYGGKDILLIFPHFKNFPERARTFSAVSLPISYISDVLKTERDKFDVLYTKSCAHLDIANLNGMPADLVHKSHRAIQRSCDVFTRVTDYPFPLSHRREFTETRDESTDKRSDATAPLDAKNVLKPGTKPYNPPQN